MSMIAIRKKSAKNGKNNKKDKNSENSKNVEYIKTNLVLVPCIQYSITFPKKFVLALLDLKNEINAIYLTFSKKLGFSI